MRDSDRREILAGIRSADWREALDALEAARGSTNREIVGAAWQLFRREIESHETLPKRDPDDVCWYRLKAAAARVLGAARYEPATDLLGKVLLGADMYPARVACAWALGQIGTPKAKDYLRKVPPGDEGNTVAEAGRWS